LNIVIAGNVVFVTAALSSNSSSRRTTPASL
jgi:hypothetical protein